MPWLWQLNCGYMGESLVLRKYMLKYLGIKGHDVYNKFSSDYEESSEANEARYNWCIWVKRLWRFFVPFAQIPYNSDVII